MKTTFLIVSVLSFAEIDANSDGTVTKDGLKTWKAQPHKKS
ncbi:hypothetical protein ABAC460_15455 [Asticcacaulis sp. AC460]|nr:hypothetical protein [Asticcacaulis sp. AC460]ESQ88427.1 hypothetical protein ABAC460_15455 [Asticcacaulis sp. AC460]